MEGALFGIRILEVCGCIVRSAGTWASRTMTLSLLRMVEDEGRGGADEDDDDDLEDCHLSRSPPKAAIGCAGDDAVAAASAAASAGTAA